jgi:hypothetical protein
MLVSSNPLEDTVSRTSHRFMASKLVSHFLRATALRKVRFAYHETLAMLHLARLKLVYDGLSLRWLRNVFRLHPLPPRDIQKINVSRYIPWDLRQIERVLRRELDWASPRKTSMPYMRFDCHVMNLIDYSFAKTTGVSEHGILLNYSVQDGTITRDEGASDFAYYNDGDRMVAEANKVLEHMGIEQLPPPDRAGN